MNGGLPKRGGCCAQAQGDTLPASPRAHHQDKWKQRCEDLRAELSLVRAEAAAAEAALQERLAAADERVRGSSKKASSEAARLRDKLKVSREAGSWSC